MIVRILVVIVGLGFAVGSGACTEEVVVLADVPSVDGSSRGTSIKCVSSSECEAGAFCNRRGCGEVAGICEPFPVSCASDEHPVCGCDGVTYFNDCLRRNAGVAGAVDEECGARGLACGGSGDAECPTDAVCAKLHGGPPDRSACDLPSTGRCWVIPATCPSRSFLRSDRWNPCKEGPDAVRCADTCTALRTGEPFSRAARCE